MLENIIFVIASKKKSHQENVTMKKSPISEP